MKDRYTLECDSLGIPCVIGRDGVPVLYLSTDVGDSNVSGGSQIVADLNAYDDAWDALPLAIQKACEPGSPGDVARGIALLADAGTLPRWRTMDSAPKDGSWVVVSLPGDGKSVTCLKYWAITDDWLDRSGHACHLRPSARWCALPPVEDAEAGAK